MAPAPPPTPLVTTSPVGVGAIDTNGAALYVGGDFTRVSGMVQEGFARFPANGPALVVSSGPADGSVTTVTRPAYGGTAGVNSGAVARVEASLDGGTSSTAGVTCTGCGNPSATWSYTVPNALANGPHTITFLAVDTFGTASSVSRTVTVDTAAPSFLSVSATGGSATVTGTFSAPVKCTSASKVDFSATVNGAARTIGNTLCTGTADATVDVVLQSPVVHGGETVTVNLIGKVTDVAGNQAPFPTTRTVVAGNAVPSLAVTSGPADGATSALARPVYGGTATDSDGTVVGIEVSIDGGTFSTAGATCTGCGTASATWGSTQTPPLPAGAHS